MDDLFMQDGITLINMDIEGAELETLKSGENIIIKNRPILSICVYHKKEDLIAIPQYIQSIVKDYVYVLRKYPSSYYWKYYSHITMQQNNELVMYAIPRERYLGL